jgi:hypothetical protein
LKSLYQVRKVSDHVYVLIKMAAVDS